MSRKSQLVLIGAALVGITLTALFLFGAVGSCREKSDPRMGIEKVVVGPLRVNGYLVYDKKTLDAIVIDPGDEPDKIITAIERKHLRVRHIVITHGHFDHVGGVARLKEKSGAAVSLHEKDLPLYAKAKEMAANWGFVVADQPAPDRFLKAGDEISAGRLKYKVIATPGHSPGSICLYGEGVAFTGDTVFAGSVGRTDLPGGDIRTLKRSFFEIMALPPETRILPGHGEESTVAEEKRREFLQR